MEDCPDQLVRTKRQAKCQQLSLFIAGKPVIVLVVSQTADGAVVIRLNTRTDAMDIIHQFGNIIVWDSCSLSCVRYELINLCVGRPCLKCLLALVLADYLATCFYVVMVDIVQ